MSYSRTSYGPGNIGNLQSGIGLTYGPTIGSSDPRIPINGMGGLLSKIQRSEPLMRQLTSDRTNVATRTSDVIRASAPTETDKMALIDQPSVDEQPYVEQYQDEPYQEEPSTIPAWIWVVGGLGVFAAIGGIVWYALK